jgi:hypothetical protein
MKVTAPVLARVIGASLVIVAVGSAVLAQDTSPKSAAPMQVLEFKPGLDDLMTLLVQPRHIKLYYAASAQNWELAAFQAKELRSAFRRAGATIPKYRNMNMDATVGSMLSPSLKAVDAAIAAKDSKQFAKAYGELTDACNACHHVMEHAFLVVKVPSSTAESAYPDQEFKPAGK